MKKVLLLSPYDALSHRQWREGLVQHMDEWAVTTIALPPRYFSWRFRGNSLTLSQMPEIDAEWDAVFATSMTDLSALRGMAPALTRCPNILYFHENQFAYPDGSADAHQLERQMTSLYSAVAADRVLFNTDFNRGTFLEGAAAMLEKMPDAVPDGVVERIAEKSGVMPVPLSRECFSSVKRNGASPLSIVWNHRWEHDKGPEELLAIVTGLLDADADFVFHLVGQPFRSVPAPIKGALECLERSGRLGKAGFLHRPDYLELLAGTDVVLSTARHEFQGLAVLEACAAGCTPVVPDRLAYREMLAPRFRFADEADAVSKLLDYSQLIAKQAVQQKKRGEALPKADVSEFSWDAQQYRWHALLE